MTKKDMQHNEENSKENEFSKEQIVGSRNYTEIEKDILNALLEDKAYTLKEVETILKEFNEKEVK